MCQLTGVYSIHEPHFWTLGSNTYVGTIKVEAAPGADNKYILTQTQHIFTAVRTILSLAHWIDCQTLVLSFLSLAHWIYCQTLMLSFLSLAHWIYCQTLMLSFLSLAHWIDCQSLDHDSRRSNPLWQFKSLRFIHRSKNVNVQFCRRNG